MTIKQLAMALNNYQKIMRVTRNTDKRSYIYLEDESGNVYEIEKFLYDVVDNGKVIFRIKKKDELLEKPYSESVPIYPGGVGSIPCNNNGVTNE